MNAKDFAHELEKAASFIRQQQAEIEALKQIIDANNLSQNIGQFVKTANKPVAWIIESDEEFKNGKNFPTLDWYVKDILNLPIGTKLYTHPVKELTDEEIANTWDDVRKDATLKPSMKDMQDFARAILRKASEK